MLVNEKNKLLKVNQVAEHLGVSERTIWRYLKKGGIAQPIRLGKGYTRWRAEDIYRALKK